MNSQIPQLPREGEQVGAGAISGLISRGGSAVIYKTWVESLEIHRAVKVMHPDVSGETRERMLTEARISSKLVHKNIIRVYNYGETGKGLPFIEMDFVNGVTLEDIIEKHGALPLPAAAAVAASALEALQYAHTVKYSLNGIQYHGVVHRDIKPVNIMIAAETGEVKLMDFGIARPAGISLHTVPGTAPGTLNYMAPETYAEGECDARSDIYQAGLLFYECVCGRAAFPQTNRVALNDAKTANAYATPDTESRAADIIEKCMRLNPDKRYQTAQDCLADVSALCSALCPHAAPEQIITSFLSGSPVPETKLRRNYLKPLKTFARAALFVIACAGLIAAAVHYSPRVMLLAAKVYARLQAEAPAFEESAAAPAAAPEENTADIAAAPAPEENAAAVLAPAQIASPAKTAARQAAGEAETAGGDGGDSALALIKHADKLFADKEYGEALGAYQKAIKTPSAAPRQEVIRKSVYGSAKCNTALFLAGRAPRPNYVAAWRSVANAYPPESPQHAEAQLYLDDDTPKPPQYTGVQPREDVK